MARLEYVDAADPNLKQAVARIVRERGELPHLYGMLLHSKPVSLGWLKLLTAVRQQSVLAGSLRELVIMRIAILNGAPYEADQHAPIALREGLTEDQLAALADWQTSSSFDSAQRAVLAYTDAMTKSVRVPEPTFRSVREHFDSRALVELTVTIAAYNMVSRFLEALEIRSDDQPA
jgi:AhpD family alkylhydroperoxidase